MLIWQGVIGFCSLLITNSFILRSLSQLDPLQKTPGFLKAVAFFSPLAYGLSLLAGWLVQSDFLILSYTFFFLNNLWFLVFFRNIVFSLVLPIKARRGFLFSMIVFLLPAIMSVMVLDFIDFTRFIFLISYILGLFPLMMILSTIVGLSVVSVTWGIILSALLFSIDLFLRSGFIPLFAEDFRFVASELFRCFAVGLGTFVFRLGRQYPRLAEKKEILPGSKQLNNVFFVILAVFPVMIFYAAFWQANLNYRDSQKKEIFLAQEVFSLSLKLLDNESNKYQRIIQEVRNATSIANAQWRLRTFQFSESELELAQILTTFPPAMEGISVNFQEDRFEIYADSDKGWGIKLVLNTGNLYQQFPLSPQQELYLFYDQKPILRPATPLRETALMGQPSEFEFAFQSVASFLGNELDAFLVFQTSVPMLSQFTIIFLMVAILVLVMIWFFYDLYLANWEKKVQAHINTLVSTKESMHVRMEKADTEMRLLRKDLHLSQQIKDLMIHSYSEYISLFLRFQFPQLAQGKGKLMELNHLLDRINLSLSWSPKVLLFQKGSSGWTPVAFSKREFQSPQLPDIPEEADFVRVDYRIGPDHEIGSILSRRDLAMLIALDKPTRIFATEEKVLLQVGMDFAAFYVRIHKQLNKSNQLTNQYMWISEMLMTIRPDTSHDGLIDAIFGLLKKFYSHAILIGMIRASESGGIFIYPKGDTQKQHQEQIDPEMREDFIQEVFMGAPVFTEHYQDRKPFHHSARSGILLPIYSKSAHKYCVVVEFGDFQVFPALEKELLFFLSKILSHLFARQSEQGEDLRNGGIPR